MSLTARPRLVLQGVMVLCPPVEKDPRWKHAFIASVDELTITFDIFWAAFCYITTSGEQYYVNDITVSGVHLVLEGHEDPTTEKVDLNICLIGANPNISSPAAVAQSAPTAVRKEDSDWENLPRSKTNSNNGGTRSIPAPPDPAAASFSLKSLKRYVKKTAIGFVTEATSIVSEVSTLVGEVGEHGGAMIANKVQCIKEEGIVRTAVHAISDVVVTAKQTFDGIVDESIQLSVAELHERMLGAEPSPSPLDIRIYGHFLAFADINLKIREALPIPLQHLERKPLKVTSIKIPLHNGSDASAAKNSPHSSAGRRTTPGASTRGRRSSSCKIPRRPHLIDSESDESSGDAWTDVDKEVDELLELNSVSSADDSAESCSLRSSSPTPPDGMPISFSAGVYSAQLLYRFERVLLVQLFRGNAGRLLYEAVKMGDWKRRPDLRPEADFRLENPLFFSMDMPSSK